MNVKPYTILTGVVLVGAGALFAASAVTSGGQDLRAQQTTELSDLIMQRQRDLITLNGHVTDLQAEVDDLAAQRASDPQIAAARARIDALGPEAGTTDVSGSGVRVTLDDAPDESNTGEYLPDDLVVHQQDVQAVVNALWHGGATAIQVMDQRLIATSAVRCVGNTLILQGRVYSPPYAITAIGPKLEMMAALAADPQLAIYRSWANLVGLGYQVEDLPEVTVPAYDGSIDLAWATPDGSAA
ncbi:unannotated protein [freshwater metagenome]|uniref:Unannotated protein n=1 Tax=freshwater metagenome TaxID=449393 RepID=A0A6J7GSX9_9ZZZZ